MVRSATIAQKADLFVRARLNATRCDPLPEELRPKTESESYEIQEAVLSTLGRLTKSSVGGYKVGFVSQEMRAAWGGSGTLGIDHPLYGGILRNSIYTNSIELDINKFFRPYVEGEFAVRMGQDIPKDGPALDGYSVREYVGACMAGIEIVDLRSDLKNCAPPSAPVAIADSGGNAGCVLGPDIDNWRGRDLSKLRGLLKVDGEIVAEGYGADLEGNPLKVLAWLANWTRSQGRQLKEGDFILLGSVTPTFANFRIDSRLSFEWEGLSRATVVFRSESRHT